VIVLQQEKAGRIRLPGTPAAHALGLLVADLGMVPLAMLDRLPDCCPDRLLGGAVRGRAHRFEWLAWRRPRLAPGRRGVSFFVTEGEAA
jgi:hypothetical protein